MQDLIIKYLKEGFTQKEISKILKKQGIKSCSLSSIEKELKIIRAHYKAKTMFHLGVILARREALMRIESLAFPKDRIEKY